ncbi:unnamed protein product [Meganyctiphanes norvegica]|uniref:Uncharacterized protein n=1 Tax=Meganyctiphanes norvegica TaxID=48144 RepID=A0AAV2RPL6_MEGNR
MRALILLTTVMCCSAQLVYHTGYPWAPFASPLLATPKLAEGEELKTVPLVSPYLHPFHAAHPLTYSVKLPEPTLKATEFPYIYTPIEESSRRKRDVSVPLPYLHAVPTVKEATFETKQFEPIEAAVPASTTKIELTTKEHTVNVPAVKYVQPVVNYKPVTYTAQNVVPYAGFPLTYSAGLPLSYSAAHPLGLHPYSGLTYAGFNPFAPLVKFEEAEEEAVESARRKRDVTVNLPYLHAVPTTKKVTFETKAFEPTDAATPADTTKIELTTKEHEVNVPAVKYVQPVVSYKPVTYTAQSVVPYAGLPLTYSAGLPLTYSAAHPLGLHPYSGLTYAGINPFAPLVKFEEAEEEVVESARRKRDVTVNLPYLHAVPTTKTVTFETKAFEPTDAATPADTTKIELTTKEHEVNVPAVKYVQPVLKYKPVTYTAHSVVPYAGLPLTYSAGHPLRYSAGLPLTYSGVHPFGLHSYAPLVKLDTAEAAEE